MFLKIINSVIGKIAITNLLIGPKSVSLLIFSAIISFGTHRTVCVYAVKLLVGLTIEIAYHLQHHQH